MGIAGGTLGTVATGTTGLTVTVPAGAVDGEMMVMFVGATRTADTLSSSATATGWVQSDTATDTGGAPTPCITVLTKVCAGDQSAAVVLTFANAPATTVGVVKTYSGADSNTPFEAHSAISEAGAGSTTHATATIVTANSGDWILGCFLDRSSATWTPPGGYTELSDTQTGGANGACFETVDSNGTVAAGSISITATASASSSTACMWIGALQVPGPLNRPTIFGTVW